MDADVEKWIYNCIFFVSPVSGCILSEGQFSTTRFFSIDLQLVVDSPLLILPLLPDIWEGTLSITCKPVCFTPPQFEEKV